MPKRSVINVDLANVWAEPERLTCLRTMAWDSVARPTSVTDGIAAITRSLR